MSLEPSCTLQDRFHGARTVLDTAVPKRRRVGRTYQGFTVDFGDLLRVLGAWGPCV